MLFIKRISLRVLQMVYLYGTIDMCNSKLDFLFHLPPLVLSLFKTHSTHRAGKL